MEVVKAVRADNNVMHRWLVDYVAIPGWFPVRLFYRHKLSFAIIGKEVQGRLHHYCGYVLFYDMPTTSSYDEASTATGDAISYIRGFDGVTIYGYDNDTIIQHPAQFDLTTQEQRLYNIGYNLYRTYTPDRVRSYLKSSPVHYGIHDHIMGMGDYIEGLRVCQ
jgi:hypothetical protein